MPTKAKYGSAPVSEVIIGVTFSAAVFDLPKILSAQHELSGAMPIADIQPPLADGSLHNFNLNTELDPSKAGPLRLRLRSEDRKWLYQIQQNKLYVNWIRSDDEEVGHYVGFNAVLNRFLSLCKSIGVKESTLVQPQVKYFDLSYHDRIEWQGYIKSISNLSTIMNTEPPRIESPSGINNIFSKFTYFLPDLGGHGILSINSATSTKQTQLLKVENMARGVLADSSFKDWIDKAHTFQLKTFEQLFSEEVLKKWK